MFDDTRDFFSTGLGLAIVYFLVGLAFIALTWVGYTVFVEPKAQQAYQFEVSDKLSTWCSANVEDPFNKGTLASLKANVEGEPERFEKLPLSLQQSIEAALRGDRVGACGFE